MGVPGSYFRLGSSIKDVRVGGLDSWWTRVKGLIIRQCDYESLTCTNYIWKVLKICGQGEGGAQKYHIVYSISALTENVMIRVTASTKSSVIFQLKKH